MNVNFTGTPREPPTIALDIGLVCVSFDKLRSVFDVTWHGARQPARAQILL